MRNIWLILISALALLSLITCASAADNFIGRWQTETESRGVPGQTNHLNVLHELEFLKDGSFKATDMTKFGVKGWTNVAFSGTYTVIDTNHANLKVTWMLGSYTNKISLHVEGYSDGEKLQIPKIRQSVVVEYDRYRRVR